MNIRKQIEDSEEQRLSKHAVCAKNSLGRKRRESECDIRTCFQRDRDRIIHSKAFRRLKHKTQVFLSPEGDHYRTRLTHTLEVSQIARTAARALRLNEDLTEAIALGHDLGHTPFGHAGETELRELTAGGFSHNLQSVRVVDYIENGGRGLNLTREVTEGIQTHSGEELPSTLEGWIVLISDRIAYINHDIDDAFRAGKLTGIPSDIEHVLGSTHSARINTLVRSIIEYSTDKPEIKMSPEVETAISSLRAFMFEKIYRSGEAVEEELKTRRLVRSLYMYYTERPDILKNEYGDICAREGVSRAVCDYIAGMTDRYAVNMYTRLFIPASFGLQVLDEA